MYILMLSDTKLQLIYEILSIPSQCLMYVNSFVTRIRQTLRGNVNIALRGLLCTIAISVLAFSKQSHFSAGRRLQRSLLFAASYHQAL